MSETYTRTEKLPMIALRGLTMFPDVILTFDVEREPSLRAGRIAVRIFAARGIGVSCDRLGAI